MPSQITKTIISSRNEIIMNIITGTASSLPATNISPPKIIQSAKSEIPSMEYITQNKAMLLGFFCINLFQSKGTLLCFL